MAKKKIVGIEFQVPGPVADYVSFDSGVSLLDWDIILFQPDVHAFLEYYETHQGKPALFESSSFRLRERVQHWRREIRDAVAAGKTVIVFLSELTEVFIDTGERTYSGTGRNRSTTRLIEPYDNYRSLPLKLGPVRAKGKIMRLAQGADLIAGYWNKFGELSEYRVRLTEEQKRPLVLTRDGNHALGTAIFQEKSEGALICLPHLDVEDRDFWTESEDSEEEYVWTKKGLQFGASLIAEVVAIDAALKQQRETTPTPGWANPPELDLPGELKIKERLLKTEKQIEEHGQNKQVLLASLASEQELKALLFAQGKELESVILRALTLLGFCAKPYRDEHSEFDVVFECPEGRFLGEAEGKDSKAINVDKLRQLEMNLHEDFARDEVEDMAKGVLFGNAHRLTPPQERGNTFSKKVHTASVRMGHALVRTPDLFPVVRYLSGRKNESFKKKCREAILSASGSVVQFPSIPSGGQKRRTKESSGT